MAFLLSLLRRNMTGPELRSRFDRCLDDGRRRSLLAAPRDILRIKPGDLLAAIASLMALWNFGGGVSMVESGSCRGVGEKSEGMFRPRGPSGDDCNESVAGLAVDEVPLGVDAEAGVTVNGTDVFMYCFDVGGSDGIGFGDGQHLLLFVTLGDEVVAVGVMLELVGASSYWFASDRGGGGVCKGFGVVSNGFGG